MYKTLTYSYLLLGLILIGITFTPTDDFFKGYYIGTSIEHPIIAIVLSSLQFRLMIVFYFCLLAFFSFTHFKNNLVISNLKIIKDICFLVIPLYIYVPAIQNLLITADIWKTILPIYDYPLSYMGIGNHFFRFIFIIFTINIIYLVFYIFRKDKAL